MRKEELQAWVESLSDAELKAQVVGLMQTDAKQKLKIHRQERSLLGLLDKVGRVRYDAGRLENALVECYKAPQHTKKIVQRTIPKRIYKETL